MIIVLQMEPSSINRIYDTSKFRTKDSENDLMLVANVMMR